MKTKKEKSNFIKIIFNYHKNHNPNFDILEGHINKDSYITYCININKGNEIMEYYSGKNYIIGSNKKNFSRNYSGNIPKKYQNAFEELKNEYRKINANAELLSITLNLKK